MASTYVSRYHLLGPLAEGGMGQILLARRIGPAGFEKLVVLKRPLGAAGHAAALLAEARWLARINHPNVCQVHDLEQGDGGCFLVLEHLEGLSLWAVLVEAERARGGIDPRAACGMFEQACAGLAAIHAAGAVHRDLSPGNLFLTEAGLIKILDLGIAKGGGDEPGTPGDAIKGKLPWLSPEQVAGRPVDARSDVFALGLVLYDLARAERPPPDRIGGVAAPYLELDALAPPLAAVVRCATQRDPAARYASAAAMGAALRDAGAALGGAWAAGELARWAEARFGAALDEARELVQRALVDATQVDAPGRAIELRSLGARAEAPAAAHRRDDDGVGPATEPLPRDTPLLRERNAGWLDEARAQLDAPAQASAGAVTRARRDGPQSSTQLAPPHSNAQLAAATGAQRADGEGRLASTERPGATQAPVTRTTHVRRAPQRAWVAAALVAIAAVLVAVIALRDEAAAPSARSAPVAFTPAPDAAVVDAAPVPDARPAPDPAPAPPPDAAPAPPPRRPPPPPPARGAFLAIESDPFAEIELDGRSLGPTPLWKVPVSAGRHTIRAELGNGRTQQRVVEARPGATVPVIFTWR